VQSEAARLQCSHVVKVLAVMAGKGYLRGTLPVTQQIFAQATSDFVGTTGSASAASAGPAVAAAVRVLQADGRVHVVPDALASAAVAAPPPVTNTTKVLALYAAAAVSGLTSGVSRALVPGQDPVSVVTAGVMTTVAAQKIVAGRDAVMTPPASAAAAQYNVPGPKLRVSAAALKACAGPGGYAKVSMSQLGSNPYAGSAQCKSPLGQLGTSGSKPTTAPTAASATLAAAGVYYVSTQFPTPQNFSTQALVQQNRPVVTVRHNDDFTRTAPVQNRTLLPACQTYNRATGKYVPCGQCNISSFTNYNVTYVCAGVGNALCPGFVPPAAALGKSVSASAAAVAVAQYAEDSHGPGQDSAEEHDEDHGEEEEGDGALGLGLGGLGGHRAQHEALATQAGLLRRHQRALREGRRRPYASVATSAAAAAAEGPRALSRSSLSLEEAQGAEGEDMDGVGDGYGYAGEYAEEYAGSDLWGLDLHRLHEASWSFQTARALLKRAAAAVVPGAAVTSATVDGARGDGDAFAEAATAAVTLAAHGLEADAVGVHWHGPRRARFLRMQQAHRGQGQDAWGRSGYYRGSRELRGAPKGGKGGGSKTARKRTSGGGHDDYVNASKALLDDGGEPPPSDDLFRVRRPPSCGQQARLLLLRFC
jgi:hypothetical protein